MGIWSEFVRGVSDGWAFFWTPWRAVCALLDRITGAAHEIALLEERLASAEFERDEYAKFVIICSCCHELVTPGMMYTTRYVDGKQRFKCEACYPRCSSCGTELSEDEGTRRVLFASNDPNQDDEVAVTCAACERGVWHCGGCGVAYEADVAYCADPACNPLQIDDPVNCQDDDLFDCEACGWHPAEQTATGRYLCGACKRGAAGSPMAPGDPF